MFDQADQHLKEWVTTILPEAIIKLEAPQETQTGRIVNLYLMGLEERPPTHENHQPSLQVVLSYFVTTWAEQPEEAHRLLGELVFAALGNPEFEVELSSLPATVWASYRLIPRPYFVLKSPVRKLREVTPTKYVTQPLSIKETGATKLYGLMVGPGDVPLSGAQVTIPALRQVQYTDARGRFCFPLVPGPISFRTIRVKVKGRELEVTPDQPTSENAPFVIRLNAYLHDPRYLCRRGSRRGQAHPGRWHQHGGLCRGGP
jgi:hypothetical protein